MTDRSVVHAAFADIDQTARWFRGPDEWPAPEATMDFRVGGVEINRGADDTGTHLIFTEQGAFLDGHDQADGRRQGTSDLLDAMGASLSTQAVDA